MEHFPRRTPTLKSDFDKAAIHGHSFVNLLHILINWLKNNGVMIMYKNLNRTKSKVYTLVSPIS